MRQQAAINNRFNGTQKYDLHPRDPRILRALARVSAAPLRTGNALTLLRNGPATYDDWLGAIARAERWVHLENYIFRADTIGQRFADALIDKARTGVPVRVLYDWFGCLDVPSAFWQRMRDAGVEVRSLNPIHVGAPLNVIHRDHRKFVGVDGVYASVGGTCIGDEWLDHSPITHLPYRDTAVAATGPVVADLEKAFLGVWKVAGGTLPLIEQPLHSEATASGEVEARIVVQEPGKMRMLRVLQVMLAGVERRVWIADAYFIAEGILREALIAAAQDGVDVRILLPGTNDLPMVGAFSRYGYRPLLDAGVRIWEYSGLMMHAKTTVADGWWSRIGSTNLNFLGLMANWELDLIAEDEAFGATMEQMYEDDLSHAREITLTGLRRNKARPSRPESQAERVARRHDTDSGDRASVAVARVGAALQTATTSDMLQQHERTLGAAIGGSIFALALVVARFPRLLAWPFAAVGSVFGGLSLVRALRLQPSKPRASKRRARLLHSPAYFARKRGRWQMHRRRR